MSLPMHYKFQKDKQKAKEMIYFLGGILIGMLLVFILFGISLFFL